MNVKPILTDMEKDAQQAARDVGKKQLARARELSPTKSGDSDKSGFVAVDDRTTQVGFRSVISRIQHERTDFNHPNGGQAKFLETAVDEIDAIDYIVNRLRSKYGG